MIPASVYFEREREREREIENGFVRIVHIFFTNGDKRPRRCT